VSRFGHWVKGALSAAIVCALSLPAAAQDQQLGARTKAMGGSYTAFQDDPLLVWLNPAGIATQPDQMSIAYQTYTAYPKRESTGLNGQPVFDVKGQTVLPDPVIIPSYVGFVFQLGSSESPMAMGVGFARPYTLDYSLDEVLTPNQSVFEPKFEVSESLSRFRVAFARDFRFRPRGDAGFLSHLAVGLGGDIGYEQWRFSTPPGDPRGERRGASAALGGGAGFLLGLYDDPDAFTLHLGGAYQSPVRFDFTVDPDRMPAFDMPQQVNIGLTLYLNRDIPLRVTFDTQFIQWSTTAQDPFFSTQEKFRDSVNYSVGAEYRIEVTDRLRVYPRLGYRRFQAPWSDKDNLPSTAGFKLVLDTKASDFNIFTFGAGISWTTEANKVRSIDIAGDVGGDAFNVAVGYTHEF
jgi:long-subunit fatty acid transport protein